MADLTLRMEHLLVTVSMIRLISLYRKLCTQKQYVSYIEILFAENLNSAEPVAQGFHFLLGWKYHKLTWFVLIIVQVAYCNLDKAILNFIYTEPPQRGRGFRNQFES